MAIKNNYLNRNGKKDNLKQIVNDYKYVIGDQIEMIQKLSMRKNLSDKEKQSLEEMNFEIWDIFVKND